MKRIDDRPLSCREKRTNRGAPRTPDEPWGDLAGWICYFVMRSGAPKHMYVEYVTEKEACRGDGVTTIQRADVVTVQRSVTDHG